MQFTPRSETTRQFIIEACAEVFNRKGFAATSIIDLEKATGLTKGSIYGNFENKDAVAIAVFKFNAQNKMDLINQEVEMGKNYSEKVMAHISVHEPKSNTSFTPGGCPFQNTAIESVYINTQLTELAGEAFMNWKNDLAGLIDKGILENEFKKDTDSLSTALHIISLIEGAALLAQSTGNMKLADNILATARTVVTQLTA
jgi:TetR/AcrR family transcriptional repressor of nem operon